ncbi:MAG: peroxiredoxin-like family protein [Kofleriaceae bacterium]
MQRDIDSLHAAGAELYVIGNGAPTFIAGFRETTGYAGPLYTDPSLEVYRAAELRSGLRTVLTVGTLLRTVGALRRGFRQGSTQGSALQQGGVLVIAPDGAVVWHHISEGPGDNATVAEIVAAVRTAA